MIKKHSKLRRIIKINNLMNLEIKINSSNNINKIIIKSNTNNFQ